MSFELGDPTLSARKEFPAVSCTADCANWTSKAVFVARFTEGLHLMNDELNMQSETASLVLPLKVTDPVPAWTVSSKEMTMAVLGGIILVPETGNVSVSAAGVPVVLCRGPVLSASVVVVPIFKVYTMPIKI